LGCGDFLVEECIEFLPDIFPCFFFNAVANRFAFYRSPDDANVLQFFQMLRNSRLRQSQFFYQVVAYAGFLVNDVLQYGYPCRMAQNFQERCQLVLFIRVYLGFGNAHIDIFILQYYDNNFYLQLFSIKKAAGIPAAFYVSKENL
tara:strand:- start:209 stop:643 length:435 start_codon:yes stop_codon:yes gene_type:complete